MHFRGLSKEKWLTYPGYKAIFSTDNFVGGSVTGVLSTRDKVESRWVAEKTLLSWGDGVFEFPGEYSDDAGETGTSAGS